MRRQLEKLWSVLQVGALSAIVFVSVQANVRSRPVQPVMISETESASRAPASILTRSVPLRRVASLAPRKNITSRVVQLPNPKALLASVEPMELEIETRQMRFERAGPAGLKLLEIRRKQASGWEPVPLVKNEAAQPLGSVFVELDEGVNEFVVIYGDVKGKKLSYPVRVQHVRKSTT